MKKFLAILVSAMVIGSIACCAEEIVLTPKEEIIKQILEEGYSYTPHGLVSAIKDGNSIYVEKFLMTGMNPNTTYIKYPALFWAIDYQQNKIVEQLIKAGVDPNTQSGNGTTPLYEAIKFKNTNMVDSLIKLGADVNLKSNNYSPLAYAVKTKNASAVKTLINAGAIVDEKALLLGLKSKDTYIKDLITSTYKAQ